MCLWRARRWAEWLAALGGGLYIPIEIYEIGQRVSWMRVGVFLVNVIIVAYMVWVLSESRRLRSLEEKARTELENIQS